MFGRVNCLYLQDYIDKAVDFGLRMDIVVEVDDWTLNPDQEYKEIGGWKTPYMKLINQI